MLADLFIYISWIFYGFGAYGIFIIRKKKLGRERDFKMKGYPVLQFWGFAKWRISRHKYSI
jgi:APA family basic amino acid/polyamine antiporter